ncbi:LysR family transcriptional regulator [Frateuria defendens]|uniref:LysR family transcriptional regulator n=1 Tax=Frateuria defendens TaxID=2219559 RepID=UPI00066FC166|nr:LysR family transcriptional regulator [Frateuria defendens]
MDRFDAMRLYTRIVALGSFARAGDELGIPRATVSHAIRQLEARLGTQLLVRTTRSVRPTLDGQAYYTRCLRLLADIEETEAGFRHAAAQPRGSLRIELPGPLGARVIVPALPDFRARYPQLELDVSASDRYVDLMQEGVDCVVRAGVLSDSGLIARRVAELSQATCVSPAYVARHGLPQSLDELASHQAVRWRSPTTGRTEGLDFMVDGVLRSVDVPGTLTVNQGEIYAACCHAGLGMIQRPRYDLLPDLAAGRLVEVLPQYPPPSLPVSVLYPAQRQLSARVRVFVEWLSELMAGLR